ncbi:MAG: holo-ACP synthase [Puniceicoccales bacterium]|jgi:holo-[acyl-carrier protein] synthase|nr:holo-ACP synthase [Puniceicoccales bacterium]
MESDIFFAKGGTAGTILGIGVDIVDVARIRRIHERHGDAFLKRVFTPAECAYCMSLAVPWPSLAARFAAKEAVSKAFGTGIGAEFSLQSVGVVNGARGAPLAELDEKGTALLASRGGSRVLVSLSHTATLAQAFAVIV